MEGTRPEASARPAVFSSLAGVTMRTTGRVSSASRGAAVKHACGSHGGEGHQCLPGLTPKPASRLARRGPEHLRIAQSWLNLASSMEHATEQPLMPSD